MQHKKGRLHRKRFFRIFDQVEDMEIGVRVEDRYWRKALKLVDYGNAIPWEQAKKELNINS